MRVQLKHRPRQYQILPQQIVFRGALKVCGIRKGISKRELMEKMRACIPKLYEEEKKDGD